MKDSFALLMVLALFKMRKEQKAQVCNARNDATTTNARSIKN